MAIDGDQAMLVEIQTGGSNTKAFNVGAAAGRDYEPVGFALLLAVAVAGGTLLGFDVADQR